MTLLRRIVTAVRVQGVAWLTRRSLQAESIRSQSASEQRHGDVANKSPLPGWVS